MMSNILLVGIFALLRKANYWLAASVAAAAKFVLLVGSASVILSALTHGKLSLALASMMGWPQLITASLGAVAVYVAFETKLFKKA